MSKEDRFTVIFDEGDWILDQETGEYMDIEQACNKLNDYEDSMDCVAGFFGDIVKGINKANGE